MSALTHFDAAGNAVMVDVAAKAVTERIAVASGRVLMRAGDAGADRTAADRQEGDVLAVAQLAGIMAAKRTAELIPLCHPLPLDVGPGRARLHAPSQPRSRSPRPAASTAAPGVEMEALTAVSVAALTVYDMCKAVDRGMRITDVRLRHKSGGKSGTFTAD